MLVKHIKFFRTLIAFFNQIEYQLQNCASLSFDNTNAMVGEHNSVGSRFLEKNTVFIGGCPCHLAHIENTTQKISGQASFISMVFSCLCCCHSSQKSFFLFVKDKSSDSKVNYSLVIVAKGFLKLLNLHMLTKQKSPLLPRNFRNFWRIANSVLNKGKSAIPPLYSTARRFYLLHLTKENCLKLF